MLPRMQATATLRLINDAIEKDQGATYRGHLRTLMPQAEDAYRTSQTSFRSHLGGSLIGRDCDRSLWYKFHWVREPRFNSKTLRLFNRGHMEEPRFVAMLLTAGLQFWQFDGEGKQFTIAGHQGHYGGSLDGVVRGLPELPEGESALAEFKTHGEKSFATLVSKGVRAAKVEHYVQMNQYMRHYGLKYALYLAVNKNTDEIYAEIIPYDEANAEAFFRRAGLIIWADEPPARITGASPGWFACKFCDEHEVCWSSSVSAPVAKNCRTCIHSKPSNDGLWHCSADDRPLDKDAQLAACAGWTNRMIFRG